MSVDLEALEKFYAHHGWIHDEPWKELLSELRALRAERDALTKSYEALKDLARELKSGRDAALVGEDALRARVAELTRLGDDLDWQANLHRRHKPESPIGIASAAWRKAVRG